MHRFKLLSRVHPVLQQTRRYIAELDRSTPNLRWPKYVLTVGAVLTVTVWSLITLFRNSVKRVLTLKQYITEEDRAECRTAAQSWIVAHKGVFTRQEIHSEIVKSAAPIFKRLSIRELSVDESLRAEREKIAADQVREVYKSLTSMDHIRIKGLYHQLALFLFYTDEELDIIMRSNRF
jgi:hypothetical protein